MEGTFNFSSYNSIKRLSEAELTALWEKYLADKTDKKTRDQLIVQYIYLVRYVVGRVKVSLPATISIEDIAGYGVEGLINAIERFSPQRNSRFETYALIRIRGSILDKVRSQDFLPRSVRKKIKEVKKAIETLKQELGRVPTTNEIASYMDMEPSKVSQIMSEDVTITSIYDKRGSSDDSMEIIDTIEDADKLNPHEIAEEKNVKNELQRALMRLPERERVLMVLYYQENMTMKEIGDTLNMSESRVCQLHAQSLMKLKNILNESNSSRLRQSIV
ncbi:MAG: FliA/WhiG family RNA polymerase sigma factor [Cyanobacteriota bacterium]|nr:FliA/WhiG family RNA polymerase sigma factor [Cyanobacteriota bacterium]MDY6357879.1 FliA/WhiG family RNA polymerase sigma factor [Cyanobacteriota bacterium]MDY6364239.1 FliA/WhiG family RNA polymerase sigma factor [Cyanobacteriota bacterium]MDY6383173.1 FliA/WhiG family RNA polymerase sigma factor [Cyanobacteriota bacterium]